MKLETLKKFENQKVKVITRGNQTYSGILTITKEGYVNIRDLGSILLDPSIIIVVQTNFKGDNIGNNNKEQ